MDTDADPEASVETGARRATFLPSIAESRTPAAVDDSERFDDDVLAAAMADETERLGLTGAISIMAPPTTPAASTPVPPPLARSVATGLTAPRTPTGAQHFTLGGLNLPSVDAEAAPASAVPVSATPALSLAELPAPSGQPVVLDAESAPAANGTWLPTRRSLRDAELARSREEHARRSAGPGPIAVSASASTTVTGTAPTPEVAISPDFSPAPGAPEFAGQSGNTSSGSTSVTPADGAPGPALSAPEPPAPELPASNPPFYDLVEPQPYSAGPAIFPLGYRSQDSDLPSSAELASQPSRQTDPFAALIADTGSPGRDVSGAEDFEATDAAALADRAKTSPWLRPTSIEVIEADPVRPGAFAPESSGPTPTPLDQRVGRASRLFWLWFAANSSVLSLAFGGALFSLGMSLRQAVVATFIGVAISFLPLGLGTLAGKWSGQPVMVVSRATFGHLGNIMPASIALLSRLFWGAVLLWMIAASTARILVGAKLAGSFTELQVMVMVMAVGFLLALVVAFFGYALFARIQLVVGILSAALIASFVVITWPAVDLATALTVRDGPVTLVVTGVVLVFSFVGLVWANSSGDLARYQRPSSSGGASMLWASFGTTAPAFLLIGYGAVLAASSAAIAKGLGTSPIDTIAGLLPSWYPVPLIAATALSLLSGVILSIYSGGFALGAMGLRVTRSGATVIVGVLVFAIAIALGFTVSNIVMVFRDLATTLAVPVAAWAGIFSSEMILRRRRFDTRSLLARGGIYRDVNWLNLAMLVVASAIGFGFTSATLTGLRWEGYLFTAVGVPVSSPLGGTDLGVLVSLALGLLTPFVAGISTIRRQERRQASRA